MYTNRALAEIIVKEILYNLKDRRGFRHLLEEIAMDNETDTEMKLTLISVTEQVLSLERSK